MGILVQQSADVRFREIDLSQTLIQESSANAAIVFVSAQGREGIFHVTSASQFLTEYGEPSAKISFGHYCALDFFREGDSLYCYRVLGTGYKYAAAILKDDTGVTELEGVSGGTATPTAPAWSSIVAGGEKAMVLFYPKHGPGSYGNSIAIRVKSENLRQPTAPTLATAASGGTLAAATYSYKISALSATGESLASTAASVVIGSGTTNKVTLTWTAVNGAVGYKVYGRTAATEKYMTTVGGSTLTFEDTGSVTPDATKDPITNPTNLVLTDEFTVEVFDTDFSSDNPVETFRCTLDDKISDEGVQMEITSRINAFSEYVFCTSNVPSLTLPLPTLNGWVGTSVVNLTGGTSGSAPTNGDIQLAWENFRDRETVDVDLLINAGYTDVGVQQKVEEIARARAVSVALLDMPQTSQKAQAMIDYRNLTLNLNSSYAAIFGPDVLESDPYNGKSLYVPFSGWAAALCARTDRVAQPWFAIAGLNRGIINVLGIRYKFNEAERTNLFKAQINYTRNFTGQGIALWEQVTMQAKASALSWLSVRRLVNVIKKSTYKFLLYSVHEPNDDFSRRTIVNSVGEYLEVIKNARGISQYLVVSNESNNPASLYNAGILKVTVFITPIIPIHEIQVDMVITKQGVTFSEINIANLG